MDVYKVIGDWLHKNTGIPLTVIHKMDVADDWTFVVTVHAMIEAVLNNSIIRKLECPELAEIVSHFETGDMKRGKLAWAKALSLMSDDARNFIRVISRLRNVLVHSVTAFDFTFEKWIADINAADFKNIVAYMRGLGVSSSTVVEGKSLSLEADFREQPRMFIFVTLVLIIMKDHNPDLSTTIDLERSTHSQGINISSSNNNPSGTDLSSNT